MLYRMLWHSLCAFLVKSGLSYQIRHFLLSNWAFLVKSGLSCQIRRKVLHAAAFGRIVHALYGHIVCAVTLKDLDCKNKCMPVAPA